MNKKVKPDRSAMNGFEFCEWCHKGPNNHTLDGDCPERPRMKPLEFPIGHPIHEVPLHGKDQFGHLPKGVAGMDKPYLGEADYQADLKKAKKKKKEKPVWALKHRKTKKFDYWYLDFHDDAVFVILGATVMPTMHSFWLMVVDALNACHATASADLSMFGID